MPKVSNIENYNEIWDGCPYFPVVYRNVRYNFQILKKCFVSPLTQEIITFEEIEKSLETTKNYLLKHIEENAEDLIIVII